MARVRFIDVRDRQVLLMDFSHLTDARQFVELTADAVAMVQTSATPHSVLALLDLTGTPIRRAALSSLRRLSENNGPFIRFMAFAGLGAITGSALEMLLRATRRTNHRVVRGRSEALDWLTSR